MIIENGGKKLAFGLEWKHLVDANKRTAATQRALDAKAPLYWHEGDADYVGIVSAKETLATKSGAVYAACEAFRRVADLPSDALLILMLAEDSYAIVGIRDGRPKRGWDKAGIPESEVKALYTQFGQLCGEAGFALVGNLPELFGASVEAFTLDELSNLADASCQLKPPSRKSFYIKVGAVAVVCVVMALNAKTVWNKYISPPQEKPSEKTATELYSDYLAQHGADPVVMVSDYDHWYKWARALIPTYGGWSLRTVVCDFKDTQAAPGSYIPWNGKTRCTLTYDRTLKAIATNETFVRSVPADWVKTALYNPSQDQYQVVLYPTMMKTVPLQTVLQNAGTANARDIHFVSVLQTASRLVDSPSMSPPLPFLVPPGVASGNIVLPLYMTSGWSYEGQFQFTELLKRFPPYTTLGKAILKIEQTVADDDTPYKVKLIGEAITRN